MKEADDNNGDDDFIDFSSLFNASISNELFQSLTMKYHPQIKSFSNNTYMSFYNQGYSLCFKNELLDSVFYYNKDINHYDKYSHKLPYNITFDMKNINIVQKFGDTPKKNGGKMPIFLCYPHLGIEITFLNSNWNDLDNPITYITQFAIDSNEKYCSTCTKQLTLPEQQSNYLTCTSSSNSTSCNSVYYCDEKCRSQHIQYHLLYCTVNNNNNNINK